MKRALALAAFALVLCSAPLSAAGITGQYIEARTCDVWTGPCFANAEMNLGGKHALMGWKVEKGDLDNVRLDGLGVVAVVAASDTLGLKQTGAARIETRCLDEKHDKVCGNESAFYPPLARNVKVRPALAVDNAYSGKGVNETWNDAGRRGAYLGSFEMR